MEFLQNNQFATGALLATIVAATLAYARNLPKQLLSYFWAQFAVSVEVKNTDPAFTWVAMWLDQQPYSKKTRRLSVQTYYHRTNEDDDSSLDYDVKHKKNRPKLLFTPAAGQHIFWLKKRLIWLSRTQAQQPSGGGNPNTTTTQAESFHVWVLGRKQGIVREILKQAMELAMPESAPETWVIPSAEGRWQTAIRRKPRTRESVILESNALDELLQDACNFLKSKDWYDKLGIPYRRGYLLHGVPGSGKTSAVLAIAGELGLDVYMLNLGDRYLDDGRLNYLLSQVPAGNIVLLEDIDAAFKEKGPIAADQPDDPPGLFRVRGKSANRSLDTSAITFSGLLNAIDGVAAREGRILFMTTNHKDTLDPALVRAGRADVHKAFAHATPEQAELMFKRFFPDCDPYEAGVFGNATPRDAISMATIQDHLLTHRESADSAVVAWVNLHHQP